MISFAHIAILVTNLDKMERFYQDVFSMKTVWKRDDDKAYLTTGNNDVLGLLRVQHHDTIHIDLEIIRADSHTTPNFPHFGVVVDSQKEFKRLFESIRQMGIEVAGPKTSRDTTQSFYFLDPESNCVQVVFPPNQYFQQQ